MIIVPEFLKPLLLSLQKNGVSAVFVGGFVRDSLLNLSVKDFDIELYNVENYEKMAELLKPFGKTNFVGKSFGVLKLSINDEQIDFSLPRIEKKISAGHKGFEVTLDPKLSFKEAAKRRDFTMNAMGYDFNSRSLLDPYNGQKDLQENRLTFVNATTFEEDPLRVFRAIQFCARFELTCKDELVSLCKKIIQREDIKELAKERIFLEFSKLLLKAKSPSLGLKLFESFGLHSFFPEIKTDFSTLQSIDIMADLKTNDQKRDLVLMFTLLVFHLESAHEVSRFLKRFTDEHHIIESVLNLYIYKNGFDELMLNGITNYEILYLSTQTHIENLLLIHKARSKEYKEIEEYAKKLGVLTCKPSPLIQGRDIIALGLEPSPLFSKILEDVYDAQLREEFHTSLEAKSWLQNYISALF
jgi:tRNA nucleotidyltransferase (CCA-adding enzyme)